MSRTVRRPAADGKAKPFRSDSARTERLSPVTLTEVDEVQEALLAALAVTKADAIGERIGCGKSKVYELKDDASQFPVGGLRSLARLSNDPDFLGRVAHALLRAAAGLAAERKAAGQRTITLPDPLQGRLW